MQTPCLDQFSSREVSADTADLVNNSVYVVRGTVVKKSMVINAEATSARQRGISQYCVVLLEINIPESSVNRFCFVIFYDRQVRFDHREVANFALSHLLDIPLFAALGRTEIAAVSTFSVQQC